MKGWICVSIFVFGAGLIILFKWAVERKGGWSDDPELLKKQLAGPYAQASYDVFIHIKAWFAVRVGRNRRRRDFSGCRARRALVSVVTGTSGTPRGEADDHSA